MSERYHTLDDDTANETLEGIRQMGQQHRETRALLNKVVYQLEQQGELLLNLHKILSEMQEERNGGCDKRFS
jgi:hypothetical protein